MPLQIPNHEHGAFFMLRACGRIEGAKGSHEDYRLVRVGDDTALVIAADEPRTQLHLDVLYINELPKSFNLPSFPDIPFDEALKVISEFYGKRLSLNLEGYFKVKANEAPAFIQAQRVKVKFGEIKFQSTGGTFRIEGAPITKIAWREAGKARLEIVLSRRMEAEVSESYLVILHESLVSARRLILGARKS